MFISKQELLLFFITFATTMLLVYMLQKKANVQGKVLNFSFGENEHLRNFQSKLFIFAIPLFCGFLAGFIARIFETDVNVIFVSAIPCGLAYILTISTVYFVPHMLIEPLRKNLFKTRVLYTMLAIMYSIFSGSGTLLVSFLLTLKEHDEFAYSIVNPIILACVLWVLGFSIYLASVKSYKKINVKYDKDFADQVEVEAEETEKEYIILQEISRLFKDTLNSTYENIQKEISEAGKSTKKEKQIILNDELIKRVNDLEQMLELAESNADIKSFKESFDYIGYLPPVARRRKPDFYRNDFINNGGYFG